MLRHHLLLLTLCASACSGNGADPADFALSTNADHYELIPGVPSPGMTITLHNQSDDFLDVLVCSHEGMPTAPIQYQQQQQDGGWQDITFGAIDCNFPRRLTRIEAGAVWTLPPDVQAFPPASGTYRIVLHPDNTSMDFPIASNSFTVIADYEEPR